jgi:ketosteroid isomerase-like protein
VEKLRKAYQAWNDSRGTSSDEWMRVLADDVTLRSVSDGAPEMKHSATRRSKAEVGEYFAGLAEEWEMGFFHADEFVSEGDRVVMIGRCRWRHRKTGKEVETPVINLWRFHDGQAVEFFEMYDTARAFAATQPG